MEKVTTVGIDLAKNVFSIHGVDPLGRVVLKKTASRAKLVETVAKWPSCMIGSLHRGTRVGATLSGTGSHGAADGTEVRRPAKGAPLLLPS